MRLKVATLTFMIAGILLLAGWPWLVGPAPNFKEVGNQVAREYVIRFGIYIIVSLVVWATTAILAIFVARQAREAYREEAMSNLQNLLEETLKDHGKKES